VLRFKYEAHESYDIVTSHCALVITTSHHITRVLLHVSGEGVIAALNQTAFVVADRVMARIFCYQTGAAAAAIPFLLALPISFTSIIAHLHNAPIWA
jgi:hypothetical protein